LRRDAFLNSNFFFLTADPLVRHAWKQWKSVCEDTGERDFTLRRRGTKDYTNSIKKGQYSHSNKYGTANRKHQITRTAETDDSNSPNYSGSVFGDSAIEEDISVDKQYSDFRNLAHYNDHTHNSSPRISANSSRSKSSLNTTNSRAPKKRYYLDEPHNNNSGSSNHSHGGHKVSDIMFTHHPNGKAMVPQAVDYTSRIEITPMAEGFYKTAIATNTIPRVELSSNYGGVHHAKTNNNPLAMLDGNYSTYQNAEVYARMGHNPKSSNNSHHYSVSHNNNSHNHNNNNNNVSHKAGAGSGVGGGGGGSGGPAHQDNHICWRKYSPHSDEFSTEL
jgi:solute carrier family 6 (neurotransmitter transporter), invertebrate